jgi:hypothetical protein
LYEAYIHDTRTLLKKFDKDVGTFVDSLDLLEAYWSINTFLPSDTLESIHTKQMYLSLFQITSDCFRSHLATLFVELVTYHSRLAMLWKRPPKSKKVSPSSPNCPQPPLVLDSKDYLVGYSFAKYIHTTFLAGGNEKQAKKNRIWSAGDAQPSSSTSSSSSKEEQDFSPPSLEFFPVMKALRDSVDAYRKVLDRDIPLITSLYEKALEASPINLPEPQTRPVWDCLTVQLQRVFDTMVEGSYILANEIRMPTELILKMRQDWFYEGVVIEKRVLDFEFVVEDSLVGEKSHMVLARLKKILEGKKI